jgi:hypothetical protein
MAMAASTRGEGPGLDFRQFLGVGAPFSCLSHPDFQAFGQGSCQAQFIAPLIVDLFSGLNLHQQPGLDQGVPHGHAGEEGKGPVIQVDFQ